MFHDRVDALWKAIAMKILRDIDSVRVLGLISLGRSERPCKSTSSFYSHHRKRKCW